MKQQISLPNLQWLQNK